MLPELTSRLVADWPAALGEGRRPASIDYMGLPGAVEGGTTTFIGFSREHRRPLFVVKIHRDADAGPRAKNEERILKSLEANASDLAPSLPRAVLCDRVAGSWVIVQTIVDGRPMPVSLDSAGLPTLGEVQANLAKVGDWLARLHEVHPPEVRADCARPVTLAARKLDQFKTAFRTSVDDAKLVEDIEAALPEAVGPSFSVTHGDFCRHNVLVSDRSRTLGVVDWTDAEETGFPLHDLLFFVSTYFLQVRLKTGLDGIKDAFFETFFGESAYASLVRGTVDAYCRRLAVSQSLRIQLGLFLVFQAVRELEKLDRLTRTSGLPRIALWLAGEVGADYEEARHASFWLYLFRELARRRVPGSSS